jgi:hypothetical protein
LKIFQKEPFFLTLYCNVLYLRKVLTKQERRVKNRLNALGAHLLIEFYNCDKKVLDDARSIEKVVRDGLKAENSTAMEMKRGCLPLPQGQLTHKPLMAAAIGQ